VTVFFQENFQENDMAATALTDFSRLAIHTMTNKPWSLAECIEGYTAAGVGAVSVWRNVLEPMGAAEAGRMLAGAGLTVPALVRGGFFPAADAAGRQAAIDDNRQCIDEAAEIGAEMVVLVVGALPGMELAEARKQVTDGIAAVLPHAESQGMKLAIEPLHPMYAADKSCVNRMAEAREICDALAHPLVGIAVDVYHVWWDPDLALEIAAAGKRNRLFAFHICDWRGETRHLLTDRGLMGDGCIDIRQIRGWVEAAGFDGYNEVEVFSEEYWATDQTAYVAKIKDAYLKFS
jgi:sugar phosphate isomerase/epimerase